jgi:hypothetical protein
MDIFSNYFNLRAYPNLAKNDYIGILRVQKLSVNHHATYTHMHAYVQYILIIIYTHTYNKRFELRLPLEEQCWRERSYMPMQLCDVRASHSQVPTACSSRADCQDAQNVVW